MKHDPAVNLALWVKPDGEIEKITEGEALKRRTEELVKAITKVDELEEKLREAKRRLRDCKEFWDD